MTSVLDRPAPPPDLVLRYAEHPDGVVDLFLPPVGTAEPPLVVHLHGGFWRQAYDRTHARHVAADLAARGAVVALPEYRRVGGAGGWPVTCHDVRDALAALPRLLADNDVAVGRTTISGHSAGGHLALWLAAQPESAVDQVVPIAPVGDLRHAVAVGMGDGAVTDFLGGPGPIDEADPARILTETTSPITVVHGTADDVVTIDNSRSLVARHPWIRLVALDGADHFDPVDPASQVWPEVRRTLLEKDPTPG